MVWSRSAPGFGGVAAALCFWGKEGLVSVNLDAWRERVLYLLLNGQELSAGEVEQLGGLALLSADADRVQDYVFESARLPEIRGASMLLQDLNEEIAGLVKQAVDPECVIYAGGGSLLAIVPDDADLLAELKHKIESLYPQRTGVATTTCVTYSTTADELRDGYGGFTLEAVNALREEHPADWQRIAAGYGVYEEDNKPPSMVSQEAFENHRGFGQMFKLAGVKLRRRKDGRSVVPFYEALSHAQRCRSCGQRPTAEMYERHEELWPLCVPCALKMDYATRSYWLGKYDDFLKDHLDLESPYYSEHNRRDVRIANDLNEIGQDCEARTGKRYVGFIYADGNSVGRLLETCRNIADFRRVSDRLKETTADAVYQALVELARPAKVTREWDGKSGKVVVHPFEIITIGGDDVLLIVPGDIALLLAGRICELFGRGMEEFKLPDGEAVSMSAGVVIADVHNPVRILRDVATQLLKDGAKRRSHDDGKAAVDFLVLKSQSMLRRDVDDLRSTYPIKLPGEGARNALRLTGTPYTLEEMKILLNLLRRMRQVGFPASQLYQLVEALHRGRERGSLFFLYQQARLHERETGVILDAIAEMWPFDEEQDPIPWNRVEHDPDVEVKYTTILPDLADLYGLVPAKEDLKQWDVVLGEVS
jgi:CRISPR-associated protein Cmr2